MKWIGRIFYIALVLIVGFIVLIISQIYVQVKYYNDEALPYLKEEGKLEEYIERYMTANFIEEYLKAPVYFAENVDSEEFVFEFAIYHLKHVNKEQETNYLAFYFNERIFNYDELLGDYSAYEENSNLARIGIDIKTKDIEEVITNSYPVNIDFRMPIALFKVGEDGENPVFKFDIMLEDENKQTEKKSVEIEKITLYIEDFTASEDGESTKTIFAEFISDIDNDMIGTDELVINDNVITSTNFNGNINKYLLDDHYNNPELLGETHFDVLSIYQKGIAKSLIIYALIVVGLTFLIFFLKPLINYISEKNLIRRKAEQEAERELEALENHQTSAVIEDAEFVENEEVLEVEEKEDSLDSVEEIDSTTDYNSMTVAELKELAKEMELTNYSTLRKNDLIELIKQNK